MIYRAFEPSRRNWLFLFLALDLMVVPGFYGLSIVAGSTAFNAPDAMTAAIHVVLSLMFAGFAIGFALIPINLYREELPELTAMEQWRIRKDFGKWTFWTAIVLALIGGALVGQDQIPLGAPLLLVGFLVLMLGAIVSEG